MLQRSTKSSRHQFSLERHTLQSTRRIRSLSTGSSAASPKSGVFTVLIFYPVFATYNDLFNREKDNRYTPEDPRLYINTVSITRYYSCNGENTDTHCEHNLERALLGDRMRRAGVGKIAHGLCLAREHAHIQLQAHRLLTKAAQRSRPSLR